MTQNFILLPQPFQLSGKTAVITGGSGLLGVQHARALVEISIRELSSRTMELSDSCRTYWSFSL